MPPFYPNLITATKGQNPMATISRLDEILAPGWGLKDSYGMLNLEDSGFNKIIVARWYALTVGGVLADTEKGIVSSVDDEDDFRRWLSAWGETPDNSVVFVAALLKNPRVKLLYIERDHSIVAGMAQYDSGQVLGISNIFGDGADIGVLLRRFLTVKLTVPIVGYGTDQDIEFLEKFGFRGVGHLSVWLKQ